MGKRILIMQGHPDADHPHFGTALEQAYCEGAERDGHEVRLIRVGALDLPLLKSKRDYEQGEIPPPVAEAQVAMRWCSHLVVIFPLWLGDMPALFKGFLEQVFRPGFGMEILPEGKGWKKLLKGRSARITVTMGSRHRSTAGTSAPIQSNSSSATSWRSSASHRYARP